MKFLQRWIQPLGVLTVACSTWAACAQPDPGKSVKVVIPYAAGQGTDIMGRHIPEGLGKVLKQARSPLPGRGARMSAVRS